MNSPSRRFSTFFLMACVMAGGCQPASKEKSNVPSARPTATAADETSPGPDSPSTDSGSNPSSAERRPIELVVADWGELQSLVATHKGKVVVVDIWSTACEPCMKEFPNLIALQQRLKSDVVCIAYDVDYAGIKNKPVDYYRERVLKFLQSQPESDVIQRMCNQPAEDLFTEIGLASIPAVYVYRRDGELARRFDGTGDGTESVSYEKQVVPLVETLLK